MTVSEDVLSWKNIIEKETSDAVDVLEVLDRLDTITVSPDILRSTGIGKCLTGLIKNHTDNEVKLKSRELVNKWKNVVGVKKQKPAQCPVESSLPKPVPATPVIARPVTHGGCPPSKATEEVMKETFEDLTSIFEADVTGNPRRDTIRKKLLEALRPREHDWEREPAEIANEMEQALMSQLWPSQNDRAKADFKSYMDKARSILWNLKDSKNINFRRKVLVGAIEPSEMPQLSPTEMASDDRNKERDAMRKYAMAEVESDWALRNGALQISGMFTCGKCKGEKTTYFQKQTRSSDEPMTTFVSCLVCNNRWKFC